MAIYDGKRRCCKCHEWYPAEPEFFYRSASKNSDGWQAYCKPCTKATAVAWQKANPEKKAAADRRQDLKPERKAKHNARGRAAYARDPSKVNERSTAWAKANPERAAARQKAWNLANPEKAKAHQDKHNAKPERIQYHRDASKFRRALTLGGGGVFISYDLWQSVLDIYEHICVYCDTVGQMTMDHIDPISRGGLHLLPNLVPACERCNKSKRIKAIEVFAPERAASIRAKAIHVATSVGAQ